MVSENIPAGATQDECILAALAHASVILPFWGLIGAIVIWATQREKSRFVGFQALQALVYQLALIVGGFLGVACYMCSFFLIIFLVLPVGAYAIGAFATEGAANSDLLGGLLGIVMTTFPFCIMGVLALVGFAYVFYGLYGAVRVLQGRDFRYAIIGRRLEQYLNREVPVA